MTRTRQQSLLDEKASLQRRLREIDTELSQMGVLPASHGNKQPQPPAPPQMKPLREIVLGMLGDTRCMLTNTVIRHLYEARYRKTLAGSRLGSLSHDELTRKNKRNTTLFGLVHPIQLVDGKAMPVKNIWARSDWPREERVFTPCTDSLIHLRFLDWYLGMRNSNGYHYLKSPGFLRFAEGFLEYTGLQTLIHQPINTIQARKIIASEISRLEEVEQSRYSDLIFRSLLAHKKSQYRDDDTD